MDEYISVEMAIKHLLGEAAAKFPTSFYLGLFAAADELKKLSAADVRPAVYAEWLPPAVGKYGCVCGHCKSQADNKTKFCPNCGADMRGSEE